MAKNYMQDVARMLGVELGKEFKVKYEDIAYTCALTEKGLYYFSGNHWWASGVILEKVLSGKLEITKCPWQPKKGEVYCRPEDGFEDVAFDNWGNHPIDFALKEAGMIFRTKEECEAALPGNGAYTASRYVA